jgi:hypothetical protein
MPTVPADTFDLTDKIVQESELFILISGYKKE